MVRSSRTLFVGNLPVDIRKSEVEDLFYKYGRIVVIDLKIPPRRPGYAFIEYEDSRDAEDAIHGRDGYDFDGHKIRVELALGGRGYSSSIDRHNSYNSGSYRGGVSRLSDYRVLVTGLPSNASWQDLKDHMRRAGDVCFSQVFRDSRGTRGFVDYTDYEHMKKAIRKLDDSEFRNAYSKAYIRVREYNSRSHSPRSHSPSRSNSVSRSPSRSNNNQSKSWSRSRSHSPKAKPSRRSLSRSPSRSGSPRSRLGPKGRLSRIKAFGSRCYVMDIEIGLFLKLFADRNQDPDPPLLPPHATDKRAETPVGGAGAYRGLDTREVRLLIPEIKRSCCGLNVCYN